MNWNVYIILCSDDSLYTGITTDVDRRFAQHGEGRGARYFRGRQPTRLVYLESGHTRSSAGKREAEIKGMTRAGKRALASSEGYALFTDVSLNPQRKCGVGAYCAVPVSFLAVPPDSIDRTAIAERLVVRRVEDTSSTKLEVQTVVWALEAYTNELHRPGTGKLRVYSDSQCVAGLPGRRAGLEGRGFLSKSTHRPLLHADLYRRFYELADELGCEVVKVAGHARSRSHDTVHRVFSWVDKEARKELALWIDELA
jgi:predicted GIY-YIG superfamily endonuclease/ribonuclease HI